MDDRCSHADVEIFAEPTAFEDTNVVVLRIAARCQHCSQRFRFVGVEEGTGLASPSSSPNGFMATLPLIAESEVPRYDFSTARN